MEENAHIFIVVVQHFAELPARYVCVVEDLVVRAFSVEILVYAVADVRERTAKTLGDIYVSNRLAIHELLPSLILVNHLLSLGVARPGSGMIEGMVSSSSSSLSSSSSSTSSPS